MSRQCIALVCDRSGSMMGKKTDTVGGINSCIEELKSKKEEDTYINIMLKLFDHEQIIVWDNIEIKEIEEFKEYQFIPRGQTALLDAMGDTISYYINKKKDDDLFYDDCCIYVITDGLENASTKWTKELIKELIETYYIIENISKPLNAISYYKLNDLINIAKKLNLEILHKQKKDIYTEISNYIKN